MAIKVATQGGETKEVEYKPGIKLSTAFELAGIKPGSDVTVSVNNKKVKKGTFSNNDPVLNDDDLVIVTPNISNG